MEKIRHHVLIVIFLLSISVPAFSDVHFALKLCNNHWCDRWLMTMAPEMSLTGQWFWISLDGTLGTVKPYGDEEGLILQSRWTIMPMLKIPFPGPFFASIGVGFSHTLRRVESKSAFADYTADTREKNQGELRALMGAEIPVSSSATVTLRGGFGFLETSNLYYFVSVGTGLNFTKKEKTGLSHMSMNEFANEVKNPLPGTATRKISIIGSQDLIIKELNTAMETVLIQSGMEIYDWEYLKQNVNEHLNAIRENKVSAQVDLTRIPSIFDMNSMEISLLGARLLGLDALLENQVRFSYKTYGGDILVQNASTKIIHPVTGKVVYAITYEGNNSSLSDCKKALIDGLIKVFRLSAE